MARKRKRNSEALLEADDDDKADGGSRRSGNGEEEEGKTTTKAVPPPGVGFFLREPNCATQKGSCSAETQEHEEKAMVLAMVHLLVAASKTASNSYCHKLIMESLGSVRHFTLGLHVQSFDLQGLLAAMPSLLTHKEKSIVVRSIALLGDMVLNSYQSVMQIARDGVVLRILLSFLTSADLKAQKEACHAIANLASSVQGQRALCEFGAVQKLMHLLFVVAGLTMNSIDTFTDKPFKRSQAVLLSGILEALDILMCDNVCERTEEFPKEAILKGLQMVWKRLRGNRHPLLQGNHICVLPKMIVWLTMEQEIHNEIVHDDHENLIKVLFGGSEAALKHFWDDHWECSPLLMEEGATRSEMHASLLKTWCAEGDSIVLKKLLTRTLACPPFCSDALDTVQIYKEIEKTLGKPMIFGQDIRLVKFVCAAASMKDPSMHAAEELDYHKVGLGEDIASSDKHVCIYADVQSCIDAYESGYSVALRGLEFRCTQIAEMAEALAICFGQATVGANLYMTPANSQGFRPHYDDHCVLIWQIHGCKTWKVWAPKVLLPRLYSQEPDLKFSHTDEGSSCKVLLNEGNLLYLPRGFPHAASTKTQAQTEGTEMHACLQCMQVCTRTPLDPITERCFLSVDSVSVAHAESGGSFNSQEHASGLPISPGLRCCSCSNKWEDTQRTIQEKENSGSSLHITFGIEVEPPFDWEGFMHMALHCWAKDQNWKDMLSRRDLGGACEISSKRQSDLYTGLLHVAIRQCADKCGTFRKACLVAAQPSCEQTHNTSRFESIFKSLVQNVARTASFKEALDMVLTVIETPASLALDWMHWLRHLSGKHQAHAWMDPVVFFHDSLTSGSTLEGLQDMEVKFTKAKESLVAHASYTHARGAFIALLYKYRSVRKRFTRGMLALQT